MRKKSNNPAAASVKPVPPSRLSSREGRAFRPRRIEAETPDLVAAVRAHHEQLEARPPRFVELNRLEETSETREISSGLVRPAPPAEDDRAYRPPRSVERELPIRPRRDVAEEEALLLEDEDMERATRKTRLAAVRAAADPPPESETDEDERGAALSEDKTDSNPASPVPASPGSSAVLRADSGSAAAARSTGELPEPRGAAALASSPKNETYAPPAVSDETAGNSGTRLRSELPAEPSRSEQKSAPARDLSHPDRPAPAQPKSVGLRSFIPGLRQEEDAPVRDDLLYRPQHFPTVEEAEEAEEKEALAHLSLDELPLDDLDLSSLSDEELELLTQLLQSDSKTDLPAAAAQPEEKAHAPFFSAVRRRREAARRDRETRSVEAEEDEAEERRAALSSPTDTVRRNWAKFAPFSKKGVLVRRTGKAEMTPAEAPREMFKMGTGSPAEEASSVMPSDPKTPGSSDTIGATRPINESDTERAKRAKITGDATRDVPPPALPAHETAPVDLSSSETAAATGAPALSPRETLRRDLRAEEALLTRSEQGKNSPRDLSRRSKAKLARREEADLIASMEEEREASLSHYFKDFSDELASPPQEAADPADHPTEEGTASPLADLSQRAKQALRRRAGAGTHDTRLFPTPLAARLHKHTAAEQHKDAGEDLRPRETEGTGKKKALAPEDALSGVKSPRPSAEELASARADSPTETTLTADANEPFPAADTDRNEDELARSVAAQPLIDKALSRLSKWKTRGQHLFQKIGRELEEDIEESREPDERASAPNHAAEEGAALADEAVAKIAADEEEETRRLRRETFEKLLDENPEAAAAFIAEELEREDVNRPPRADRDEDLSSQEYWLRMADRLGQMLRPHRRAGAVDPAKQEKLSALESEAEQYLQRENARLLSASSADESSEGRAFATVDEETGSTAPAEAPNRRPQDAAPHETAAAATSRDADRAAAIGETGVAGAQLRLMNDIVRSYRGQTAEADPNFARIRAGEERLVPSSRPHKAEEISADLVAAAQGERIDEDDIGHENQESVLRSGRKAADESELLRGEPDEDELDLAEEEIESAESNHGLPGEALRHRRKKNRDGAGSSALLQNIRVLFACLHDLIFRPCKLRITPGLSRKSIERLKLRQKLRNESATLILLYGLILLGGRLFLFLLPWDLPLLAHGNFSIYILLQLMKNLFCLLLPAFLLIYKINVPLKRVTGRQSPSASVLLISGVTGVPLAISLASLQRLLEWLCHQDQTPRLPGFLHYPAPPGISESLILFISGALIAGFSEELFARGILLSGMLRSGRIYSSLLLTGLVCALISGDRYLIFAAAAAFLFSWLRYSLGSIYNSMAAQVVFKSSLIFLISRVRLFAAPIATGSSGNLSEVLAALLSVLVSGIVLFVLLSYLKGERQFIEEAEFPRFSRQRSWSPVNRKFLLALVLLFLLFLW